MIQSQPMEANPTAAQLTDCINATIVGFLLPFFLAGAGGNQQIATAAIQHMIDAHHPGTPTQLDLVGRILGFSIAALDNLRLSMTQGLSDTKLLRYRTNAVALGRSSDASRKILHALQTGQEVKRDIPRPSIAAAPPAPKPAPQPNPPAAAKAPHTLLSAVPPDLDAMKRDARTMMTAFSKNGAAASVSPLIPDTATMVRAAARAAVAAAVRPPAA